MGVASCLCFCFRKTGCQNFGVLSSLPAVFTSSCVPTNSSQPDVTAMNMGFGVKRSWIHIPALPLTGRVALGRFLNLSEIQFSNLENRDNTSPISHR